MKHRHSGLEAAILAAILVLEIIEGMNINTMHLKVNGPKIGSWLPTVC